MTSRGGVVFLAASALGQRCCEALLDRDVPVVKILSIRQEFRISWSKESVRNAQFADLVELARQRSIPFSYVTGGRVEDYQAALGQVVPELFVVAGWYYLIPDRIRAMARLGAVGLHASLLPKYRGGAPLVWAIINGEMESGVTLFHLGSGVDDGDIVAQSRFPITKSDDIATVVARATTHAVALVSASIPDLLAGTASRAAQDERAATVVPQRTPVDGLIQWDALSSEQAFDWIRAQTAPYPGAYTFLDGERITIWVARPAPSTGPSRPPGTLEARERLTVWCADAKCLEIVEVSAGSGERIVATELIARLAVRSGLRFGPALERA